MQNDSGESLYTKRQNLANQKNKACKLFNYLNGGGAGAEDEPLGEAGPVEGAMDAAAAAS
jgi:hypothetical protein